MALPAHWKLVKVFGTYLRSDGLPNTGSVWFESQSPVYVADDAGTPLLVIPRRLECPLNSAGYFEVMLPTTNDPTINPKGWTYGVREQMPGGREFAIDVPIALNQINLITWAQATPIPTPPPTVSYLTTLDIGANVASQQDMNAANAKAAQAAIDAASALGTANAASGTATTALNVANGIDSKATQALATSNTALTAANSASSDAAAALSTANGIDAKATQALNTANAANTTANGIDAKATQALNTANAASTNASNAVSTANNAQTTANGVDAKATQALNTANAAQTTANNAQPHDATLDGIAALTVAAGKMLYTTDTDVFAASDLTAFGRAFMAAANAAAGRTALALGGAALLNVGSAVSTVAAGDDPRFALSGWRNRLMNPDFDIWQRGLSLGTGVYASDRWRCDASGSSIAVSRQTFPSGNANVPTKHGLYFMRVAVNSVAGANNYAIMRQFIEDPQLYSGRAVTVSIWLRSAAAGVKMSVDFQLVAGAQPTAALPGGQIVTTTTGWARYLLNFTLPDFSGATFDANSALIFRLGFDAGANVNLPVGQQSFTALDISQPQLEYGTIAVPDFEKRLVPLELSMCQRYFEKSYNQDVFAGTVDFKGRVAVFGSANNTGQSQYYGLRFMTLKRIAPTVLIISDSTGAFNNVAQDNGTNLAVGVANIGQTGAQISWANTASRFGASFHYTADSDF